jgi:hypothetical protein
MADAAQPAAGADLLAALLSDAVAAAGAAATEQ